MLRILSQEICKLNIKWDDSIEELVNKWDEIAISLASSEIIFFKGALIQFGNLLICLLSYKNIVGKFHIPNPKNSRVIYARSL